MRPARVICSGPPLSRQNYLTMRPPCDSTAPSYVRIGCRRFTLVTTVMSRELLSSHEAARRLGVSPTTLYDWLAQSDAGTFMIRGQPVVICYYQGGRRGQGRIKIDGQEVERLLALMRVSPIPPQARRPPSKKTSLNHITTQLGRPDD